MFAVAFGVHIFAVFLILIVTNAVNDSDSADVSLSPSENANTYPQVLVAMVLGVLFSVCWLQLMCLVRCLGCQEWQRARCPNTVGGGGVRDV